MSIQVKRRRGNTAAHSLFTGAQGELTVNTDTNRVHVHDGSTPAGHPSALLSDLVVVCTDTSSTGNTITVASNVGPAAPVDGMLLLITAANLSTGGCTVNYNGSGAVALLSGAGAGLVSGAVQASAAILVQYRASTNNYYLLGRDGGNAQFASPLPISQGGTGASTVAGALAALGLTEALTFAGTWNAATNMPALTSGSGVVGAMYKVSTAGATTLDGISTWAIGDQAVFSGTSNTWVKIDGVSSEVLSVAGRAGVVVITSVDLADFATAAAAAAAVKTVAGRTGAVVLAVADVSGAAALASPTFTGVPVAPTPSSSDNSTALATTAFVAGQVATLNTSISAETTRATAAEATKVGISAVGAASGVAPLDGTSRVPFANLPASLSQAVYFAGTWNASTNMPALTSGTGNAGASYKISTAGTTTLDGISSWNVGDQAVFNGVTSTWQKIDGIATEVLSVVGRTGAVVLAASDVTNAADVTQPNTFQKTVAATVQAPSYSSTITLDLTQGNDLAVTLTGNAVIANPSAMTAGSSGAFTVKQDSTGARTVTWGGYWKFGAQGTPVLSATASAWDTVFWHCIDSTHIVAGVVNGVQ